MKEFIPVGTQPVAQGELLILRVDRLPSELKPMETQDGKYIIGHSETGHHHVVYKKEGVEAFELANDNSVVYLKVDNTQAFLDHERSFDTHKGFQFDNGVYVIRRQTESFLEGFRKALD